MTTYDRSSPIYYVSLVPDGDGNYAVRVENFSARVLTFKYEDEEQKADRLTITLNNFDLVLYDDPAFKSGMLLDVTWGYRGRMAPTRRCVVQSIKGGKVVTITALAQSILMNKRIVSRSYRNSRYSDIARTLAREAGFGDDAIDIEETPVIHDTVSQARLSDAQFIRRLADKEGFEFYVDHEGYHFHRRRIEQAPVRVFTYYIDQEGGDVLDFNLDDDITKPKAKHRRRGRNLAERTEIDEEASNETDTDRPTLTPIVPIPTPTTTSNETSAHVSTSEALVTFDNDTSAPTLSERSSGDERIASSETLPTSAQDATTAQREATGQNRKSRQATIKLNLDVVGDPYTVAKTVVEVRGIGTRLSGRYYIKRVVNDVGGEFKQKLELIADGHHGHARRSRMADLELPHREEPSTGTPNNQPVADPAALEPVITFDHDTSAPTQQYRPRAPRSTT